ncbi:hypothetical protein CHELA1G11_13581 [Hyphomicrobiales bacterium]|nr:hypothetical protein CHELA1G2_10734 [Hyphomicrobiales bacterium]CAH1672679.1 hypothetical protein CHELA1G11_13581 [Hyphomicrobiales bacterium]
MLACRDSRRSYHNLSVVLKMNLSLTANHRAASPKYLQESTKIHVACTLKSKRQVARPRIFRCLNATLS